MFGNDLIFEPDANYRSTLSVSDLYIIEHNDFYGAFGDSALEQTIPFTEFNSVKHNKGEELQFRWADFVKHLINTRHRISFKKSGPLIGGYWLKENATRSNENVELVFLFICDIDSKGDGASFPSFEEMEDRFKQGGSGIFGSMVMGYTTFNHSPEQHRYRLIFPLARAVLPSEYPALWEGINGELGGILDPATKDVSRIHYFPICASENLVFAKWFTANDDGSRQMLNPEPLIVAGNALTTPQKLAKTYISTRPETPREIARVQEMLDHISADCDYETYRDVVWSVLSTGWTCAEQLAENWCQTAPHRFEEDDFINVVNSYNPNKVAPITLGTLNFLAKKGGWHG
jgi:putative DNA primase/helicase